MSHPPTQSTGFLSGVAYAPFGETYASSGTTDVSFTGMNPDTTGNGTGSDYDFLFRPYSTQGRWPTPDPAGLAAADPTNPQSWNRYAYVLNNPFAYKDPTGLDCIWVNSINDEIAQYETGDGDCTDNGNLIGFYVEGDGTVVQGSVVVDANGDVSGFLTNGVPFCSGSSCDVFTTVNVSASPLLLPGGGNGGGIGTPISSTATMRASPNAKVDYCHDQSVKAALEELLPGITRGEYLSTAAKVGKDSAAHLALDGAAASGVLKRAVRAKTGIPMSTTEKILGRAAVVLLLYSGYKALRAASDEGHACTDWINH